MSVAEDVETCLSGWNQPGPANKPDLVVEGLGEDEAIVRCDPPRDWQAKQLLGMDVTPALEAAGFDVLLGGGLRRIPGLPRGITGGTRYSNEREYRQRDLEEPRLRVRRKA